MTCPKLPFPELFSVDGPLGLSIVKSLLYHDYVKKKLSESPPLYAFEQAPHGVRSHSPPTHGGQSGLFTCFGTSILRLIFETSIFTARGILMCAV